MRFRDAAMWGSAAELPAEPTEPIPDLGEPDAPQGVAHLVKPVAGPSPRDLGLAGADDLDLLSEAQRLPFGDPRHRAAVAELARRWRAGEIAENRLQAVDRLLTANGS